MIERKGLYLELSLILVMLSTSEIAFVNARVISALDLPVHIHLSWQQSDMSSTIVVTWQTAYSDSGTIVFYDNVSRGGGSSLYTYSTTGTVHIYSGASGYVHDTELTDLSQDSTYYFVCGGEIGGYSTERSFKTAPKQPSHLTFVVGGDCRSNSTQRDIMSNAMRQLNPSFVLFSGDMVETGSDQAQWDDFLQSLDSYWVGSNGQTIPIVPSLGNHEQNATAYYEQFALPNNKQWYSLDWGETVHITVLNSEANASGEQLQWLENDLATHENCTWKFVLFHQPLFSSGPHGSWIEGRSYWCPLFDKYHVDIVFSGHDHDYERSKPINYTASMTAPQNSYAEGTMYIVSGGWRAPLHSSNSSWWTAYSSSLYHFVQVDIFGNQTLNVQAKDASGTTFDMVIQKSPVVSELLWNIVLAILLGTAALMSAVQQQILRPLRLNTRCINRKRRRKNDVDAH